MEKNVDNTSVQKGGARYYDAAGENKMGGQTEIPFSRGSELYSSAPNQKMINGSGMDNFQDERFAGHKGATDIGDQGEVGKDAIDYTATVDKKPLGFRRTEVAETSPNEHGD